MAEAQRKVDPTKPPEVQSAAPSRSGATVAVACNVPQGLLLQLYEMEESSEQVMGGGWRSVRRAKKVGTPVRIRGPAIPIGFAIRKRIVGGYAITRGVDADFFNTWLEQNKDSDVVRNRCIFAHKSDTDGMAREHRGVTSGYEPLDPKGDPRRPKPRQEMTGIEKDSDAKELEEID